MTTDCLVLLLRHEGRKCCAKYVELFTPFHFFFYRYIIPHTFKQNKNTITRYKYIESTWEKHKKKSIIKKKVTKNN